MEVRRVVDDLRDSLGHITAEDELLGIIVGRLADLRRCYPSHRSLFSTSDIEFLKSLGTVADELRAFIEVKEELVSVSSLTEYKDSVSRLTRAKAALSHFPVARRVAKEIRGLQERLPAIRQQEESHRQFRLAGRILELEQNPRRCPRRHPMVIREGSCGHFWGCSRYPFCSATSELTPAEKVLLNS